MTGAAATLTPPMPVAHWSEPETIVVDGVTLALRRGGVGEPVVFLNGHWASRRWLPVHQALAERHAVIAPEAPGFGASELPSWIKGRDDVVLLLRDLLDALDLGRVHLVGYGLGGWTASELAVWFHDRVRSLTLLAPFGLRVPGHPLANIFLMNPAGFAEAYGLLDADPALVAGLVPGVATPADGGMEEWAHRYGEMGAAARLMWQWRYDLALDHRLPQLAGRGLASLVVGGSDDRILPSAHIARWAELLGATTATVDGGHAFPFTAPHRTADVVASFIESLVEVPRG